MSSHYTARKKHEYFGKGNGIDWVENGAVGQDKKKETLKEQTSGEEKGANENKIFESLMKNEQFEEENSHFSYKTDSSEICSRSESPMSEMDMEINNLSNYRGRLRTFSETQELTSCPTFPDFSASTQSSHLSNEIPSLIDSPTLNKLTPTQNGQEFNPYANGVGPSVFPRTSSESFRPSMSNRFGNGPNFPLGLTHPYSGLHLAPHQSTCLDSSIFAPTLFNQANYSDILNNPTFSQLSPQNILPSISLANRFPPFGLAGGAFPLMPNVTEENYQHVKDSTKKKRQQKCSLCSNHGLQKEVKGHKWFCDYRNCECEMCKITRDRQHSMKEQQKLTRHLQRIQ